MASCNGSQSEYPFPGRTEIPEKEAVMAGAGDYSNWIWRSFYMVELHYSFNDGISGVESSQMAYVMVLAGAGMVVGNLAGGIISDKLGPEKTCALLIFLMMISW
jgi:MFS family permease